MRLENLDTCSNMRRDELIAEAGAIVFFDERLLVGHDLDSLAMYCSQFNERAMHLVNDPLLNSLPIVSKLKSFSPLESHIRRWIELPYVPNIQPVYKQMAESLLQRNKTLYYFSDTFREQAQVVARAAGIPAINVRAHKALYKRNGTFRSFSRVTPHARFTRIQHLHELGRELGCEMIAYFAADLTDRPIRFEHDAPTEESDNEVPGPAGRRDYTGTRGSRNHLYAVSQ